MNPSLELREEAAKLHEEMTKAEDELSKAQDAGLGAEDIDFFAEELSYAEQVYNALCRHYQFRLMTDASGLFLRCAETQIPLVDSDEVIETETGQLLRVKQAA